MRTRIELLNIGNELKDAYVLSTGERLEYSTLKCCGEME